jgi:hypothetical protein
VAIERADLADLDFVDAVELAATGSRAVAYRNLSIVSITAATREVVVNPTEFLLIDRDNPVQAGDLFTLTGASASNGDYTIQSIIDDQTFVVVETVPSDGTGGSGTFYYPPGASKVGIGRISTLDATTETVQEALEQHPIRRELVHLAEGIGGPFEDFTSGAYREILPAGDPFPTSVIWWTDSSKTDKIVELTLTYTAFKQPATMVWKSYDSDGSTVLRTVTDTMAYTSNVFEHTRTRTVT